MNTKILFIKSYVKKIFWMISGGYKPEHFWNSWAKSFMDDPWQVKTHKQHEWMLSLIRKDKPKSILEVGCGFGRNIRFFQENGIKSEITGIDISKEMIRKAKKFIKNKKVPLVIGDILNLPFKDSSFDLVITHGVLMHVKKTNIDKAFSELLRVSRKSLIIIEQNYGGNEYTFIHNYRKLCRNLNLNVVEYEHSKKLGLDLIYAQIRKN